jgi:hypothetical protein
VYTFDGGITMKELLEFIAKSLVDFPEDVSVTEIESDRTLVLELRVSNDDMGKVIGKHGRIAKAIRAVVKSDAFKTNKRVMVEIVQ